MVKVELKWDEFALLESFLSEGPDLPDFIQSFDHALTRVIHLIEAHFSWGVLERCIQRSVNLRIDLCWQVVLQVIVRLLGIINKIGHIRASLLNLEKPTLLNAQLFLELRIVVILILNHGFELSSIS